MTNIVITTLSPFENRGVEALAISNIEGLRRVFDDARITVLTQQVEAARPSLGPYDVLVCLLYTSPSLRDHSRARMPPSP